MNFVLTMFFGSSGLLHILVTMKQHNKSLVLTTQYTHAKGTVLCHFRMTKYYCGTWLPQSLAPCIVKSTYVFTCYLLKIGVAGRPVNPFLPILGQK